MSKLQTIEEQPINQEMMVLKTLENALNKGVDADSLEKLLNMQERVLNRNAEQAYYNAMREVQAEMIVISKNRTNSQTNSGYADLSHIQKAVTPVYTKHGFCLSFGTADSPLPEHVRITCDVMHSQGHQRAYMTDIPLDTHGIKGVVNKTGVHGTGSAMSYGQRYLTKLIFNLNTGEEDDDGNAAGGDTRSAKEIDAEWIARVEIWRDILPSILMLKENIALNEISAAYEVWAELTAEEKNAIWRPAPTKGGILTVHEKTIMNSSAWKEAHNDYHGLDPAAEAQRVIKVAEDEKAARQAK